MTTFHEFAHIDPLGRDVPTIDDLFAFFDVQAMASITFYKKGDSAAQGRARTKIDSTLVHVKRILAERERKLSEEDDWYSL